MEWIIFSKHFILQVSNRSTKLLVINRQLSDTQIEKAELEEQIIKLQAEAEETCHNLEDALHKNSVLRQTRERAEGIQVQLESERSIRHSLEVKIEELENETEIKEQEMKLLNETISSLEQENAKLQLINSRNKTALTNLHEQVIGYYKTLTTIIIISA